ncbi:Flp pilus assembly protein TadD [Paraburkholderia youngii]|uniref:tetratricopeptide repeat protein n=1 Tax=Paraburkholderia youngii TaxID=2782701 RepID=UPI003D21BC57
MDISSRLQDLNNRAISLYSSGRVAEALAMAKQLLHSHPANVEALHLAAACSLDLDHKADAEQYLLRAIREKPDVAEAHISLGLLYQQLNRSVEAVEAYKNALSLRPDLAEVHSNLGLAFEKLGRVSDAEFSFQRAITLRPDLAETQNNLGRLLAKSKRYGDAEVAFQRALALRPDFADAYSNYGSMLYASNRLPEAEAVFRHALALRPDSAQTRNNYGSLLCKLKRIPEAEANFLYALGLRSDLPDTYTNYGILLYQSKRFAEADALFRRAIDLGVDDERTHNNYGNLLRGLGRFREAEEAYKKALMIRPDLDDAKFNLSVLLLYIGRWTEGWPLYEARYHENITYSGTIPPPIGYPQWQGESLDGRSLLVWPEQGFGDEIQFVRYLPLLKARGAARITLVCRPELHELFRSVDGADAVLSTDTETLSGPVHDFWTFLLSIPVHLGTTPDSIPGSIPYLRAPGSRLEAWRPRLPDTGIRVGLVWKGRDTHRNDSNRSLPSLATLAPLWNVSGVTFISLQKGPGEEEVLRPPVGQPILSFGSEITDFADTAAIISQLDLIITIDSAVAHLAGALAKPCWVLLPSFETDWRWMVERGDFLWYPNVMRLFRQKDGQEWSQIVGEMATSLQDFADQPAHQHERPTSTVVSR